MSFEHTLPYRAKRRSRVCSYLDMTEEGNEQEGFQDCFGLVLLCASSSPPFRTGVSFASPLFSANKPQIEA